MDVYLKSPESAIYLYANPDCHRTETKEHTRKIGNISLHPLLGEVEVVMQVLRS
jgi:hypothetical protein